MTWRHYPQGWLLYANPCIGEGTVLSGGVMSFELNWERSYYGSSVRVTCELPAMQARTSPAGASPAPLESLMWDALQGWPEPGIPGGRRWPPEMEALLALARNHPEEYERLREGEAVLRALGG